MTAARSGGAPSAGGANGASRVLVTGGAGFIGSHLVERLLAQGARVCVVDDLSTGREENLAPAREGLEDGARLEFLRMPLAEALRGPLAGRAYDRVYHLAAAVGVRLILERPLHAIETNISDTAELLRFVARSGTPTLIASSSEVYGKSDKAVFSEDDDVVYGPTTKYRWSYAASKAIDEYLALAHHAEHGLPVVVARFFNTVGPRQVGSYGMVLPRFVQAAREGKALIVHGDGQQTRCFCDVRDVVGVLPRMLETGTCHGRVFNVGSDNPISMIDLARRVARVLGSGSSVALTPYDGVFGTGFEDLRHRRPDLRRVRDAVGFDPSVNLDDTIRDIARHQAAEESGTHP